MDKISLDKMGDTPPVKPKLPKPYKLIRVGELLIITKWAGFGWKQVTDEEFKRIKRDYDLS